MSKYNVTLKQVMDEADRASERVSKMTKREKKLLRVRARQLMESHEDNRIVEMARRIRRECSNLSQEERQRFFDIGLKTAGIEPDRLRLAQLRMNVPKEPNWANKDDVQRYYDELKILLDEK